MRDNYYTIPISSPPPSIGSPLPSSIPSPSSSSSFNNNSSFLKSTKKCHRCMAIAALCLSAMGLFINLFHLNVLTTGDGNTVFSQSQHWAHLPPKKVTTAVMRGQAANDNNNNNVVQKPTTRTKQQINEMTIFQKMHSRAITALESCRSNPVLVPSPPQNQVMQEEQEEENQNRRKLKVLSLSNTPSLSNNNSNNTSSLIAATQKNAVLLPPFGITNALSNIIHQLPQTFPQEQCYLPPTSSCDSTSYSVIFTFVPSFTQQQQPQPLSPLRGMFLQLLKLISYTSISEIIVFIPSHLSSLILDKKDREYGARLKLWDEDEKHKVRLIFVDEEIEFWGKYNGKLVQPREEVLLYIHHVESDESIRNDNTEEEEEGEENDVKRVGWNERTFDVGFELFKRSSQAFVTYQDENYYNWNIALESNHLPERDIRINGESRRLLEEKEEVKKVRKKGDKEKRKKQQKQRPNLVKKEELGKKTNIGKEAAAKKKKETTAAGGGGSQQQNDPKASPPLTPTNDELDEKKVQLAKEKEAQHENNKNNNDEEENSSNFMANHFQPKCQHGLIASYPPIDTSKTTTISSNNHFFFIHRDYLCFISHPLFKELRNYISKQTTIPPPLPASPTFSNLTPSDRTAASFEINYYNQVMTISTIISQLSGVAVHTFPLVSALSSAIPPPDDRSNVKMKNKKKTSIQQQEQQLMDGNHANILKQKNEMLNTLFDYFGTIPPKSKHWCDFSSPSYSSTPKGDADNYENCKIDGNGVVVDVKKIPWMNVDGVGYNICPQ